MTVPAVPLAGVLGWPVAHSLSPLLHGHWLAHLGIKGFYVPLGCPPEAFDDAVPALLKTGFVGFNVTVPHKEAAAQLCDVITPRAEQMGSANTIWREDGRLMGDSTDGLGFLSALPPLPSGANVLVVGAGGSAKAIVHALAGLDTVAHITIANRTLEKAEQLAQTMRPLFPQTAFDAVSIEACQHALESAALIVNTTTLGMIGQPPLSVDLSHAASQPVVYDIVYTPAKTPLLKAAEAAGLTAINGLHMLIGQARPGFAKWFGMAAPHTGEEAALLMAALSQSADGSVAS